MPAGRPVGYEAASGFQIIAIVGLMINAIQHAMIYVGLGMSPAANRPGSMNALHGPGPDTHDRLRSFVGPTAVGLQVASEDAPSPGDLETAEG